MTEQGGPNRPEDLEHDQNQDFGPNDPALDDEDLDLIEDELDVEDDEDEDDLEDEDDEDE